MPEVIINGRFLSRLGGGVQRYALEIVRALDRNLVEGDDAGTEVALHLPADADNICGLDRITQRYVGRHRGHLWEQIDLPLSARGAVLVNLCNTAPIAHTRQIMTIHDAGVFAHPESYAWPYRSWHRFLCRTAGRAARQIVTVSAFSRDELTRFCPFVAHKVAVIPNAAEHILVEAAGSAVLEGWNLTPGRYILVVANDNRLKNLAILAPALEPLGAAAPTVAVVGRSMPRVFGGAQLPLGLTVVHLQRVSDAELRALYRNALCLVFPSLYEGFGIPPLEAMQCGCPVLAAAASSLPEVCGNAALYFDPHDPMSLTDALRRILADETLRRALIKAGLQRAAAFNWRASAALLSDAIARMAGTPAAVSQLRAEMP